MIYSRTKRLLSDNAREAVEGSISNEEWPSGTIRIGTPRTRRGGVNLYGSRILDELTELERRWV